MASATGIIRPAIIINRHGKRSRVASRWSQASSKPRIPIATPVGISQKSDSKEWPFGARPALMAKTK